MTRAGWGGVARRSATRRPACIQQVVEELLARATLPDGIATMPDWPIRIDVP